MGALVTRKIFKPDILQRSFWRVVPSALLEFGMVGKMNRRNIKIPFAKMIFNLKKVKKIEIQSFTKQRKLSKKRRIQALRNSHFIVYIKQKMFAVHISFALCLAAS